MNWDQVEGNWKQFKGKIKEQWGALSDDEIAVINGKRFSIREFLLGNEAVVPAALRPRLKAFLYELMTGFREIAPALSLSKIRF